MKRAFVCHNSKDSKFVLEVCQYLKQNLDDIYYYEDYQILAEETAESFVTQINYKLVEFEIFIAFISEEISSWQRREINSATILQNSKSSKKEKKIILVLLRIDMLPSEFTLLNQDQRIKCNDKEDTSAHNVAKEIIGKLGFQWKSKDGLPPVSNFFQYEKNIIQDYINLLELKDDLFKETKISNTVESDKAGKSIKNDKALKTDELVKIEALIKAKETIKTDLREKLIYGLPPTWPKVKKMPSPTDYHKNTVDESIIGKFRQEDAKVVAAALTSFHPDSCGCLYKNQLTFPEAGPRASLFYPRKNSILKVAILVAGGIAPGINSVIHGITQRHELYAGESINTYRVEIYGLRNGFYSFDDYSKNLMRILSADTSKVANDSGSFIGTSRDDRLIETSPIRTKTEK